MIRQQLRRGLNYARQTVVGRPALPVMTRLIRGDQRASTFFAAIEFVNYEQVPGDIVEFGVFTGISLALLAQGHRFDDKGMARRVAGFDSFDGLPPSAEEHARWREGACQTNHAWHPLAAPGARVTPEMTRELFAACGLPAPELHVGLFDQTVPPVVPATYSAVAVVHIDCDLYESTQSVLTGIAPALVVMQARTLVRTLSDTEQDPLKLLERINARLAEDMVAGRFVTMFLGFLSPEGFLEWSSGGHGPVLFRRRRGQAIESLDNKVADEMQSRMLIDTSRQLERGTKWFLRSRRLVDDMVVNITKELEDLISMSQHLSVVGGFQGDHGEFYAQDEDDHRPVKVRYTPDSAPDDPERRVRLLSD